MIEITFPPKNAKPEEVFLRLKEALAELDAVLPEAPLSVRVAIRNVFAALTAKDDFVMQMHEFAVRLLFIAVHLNEEPSNRDQVH